jgi:hypothetical protein
MDEWSSRNFIAAYAKEGTANWPNRLKNGTAYAARGPTDRPPRSWRATHFNQFPWRTAVTTTWPLRRLLNHSRYRSLSLSPENQVRDWRQN